MQTLFKKKIVHWWSDAFFCRTFKNLEKRVVLECDGEAIPLPSLQGIVVLNISSFMGGTNFWGNNKDDEFLPPSFDDGILEVRAENQNTKLPSGTIAHAQYSKSPYLPDIG